jgi:hypothetical protein
VFGAGESVVEGHQDRPDLAGGIETLEKKMRVGRQDADAIAAFYSQIQQYPGEAVDAFAEVRVAEADITIDDGCFVRITLDGSAQEIIDQEGDLHGFSFEAWGAVALGSGR